VLDCFAGSGVVGRAAKMLERQAILIEIEEEWCQKIAQRFSKPSEPLPKVNKPAFDWR
jgi:site-specific DNA-methyltransferase (adenine-specific)